MWRKRNPGTLLVGIQSGAAAIENCSFLTLKMELLFNPVILGIDPKNPKAPIRQNMCTPMLIAAQLTIAKIGANQQTSRLKNWYIYTVQDYAVVKSKNLYYCLRQMKESEDNYAKQKKPEKDKYHMISLVCGI